MMVKLFGCDLLHSRREMEDVLTGGQERIFVDQRKEQAC